MAASTCYFLIALVCGAVCNPLGQTTICETQNRRNGLLQALGSTTVCDATPNLFGRGYRHGHNLQGAPYLPSYMNGPFCPYGISPGYGSTTVCENVPNVGPGLGVVLGGLGGCSGLSPIIPGSTTVCESTPNLGLGTGCIGYGRTCGLGAIVPGSATVCTCDSTPNFGPGLSYGGPYFPNSVGPTTICESITPNLGLGIGCNGYVGAGGVCTCDSTPNFGPGLCYGGPYVPNSAGQTTVCESITPNLGLGIGCNGCGGAGGVGAIFPGSATVCSCDSTPNFGPGLSYGGPYFPNSVGPTTICESITPNLGLEIGCNEYGGAGGVCTCDSTPNFVPGLCYGGPYFPNSAGHTTVCESITPNLGLGIGCNGCGGAGGVGPIFPGSATVCSCDSTPNFGSGVCYGGPYFPNRAGQINICDPNVSPGYLYGIPRCNNFGLGHGYHQHTSCNS